MANYTLGSFDFNGDIFTIKDTTYERRAAREGGTDVSLVNTNDIYVWNNKQDKLVSGSNIKTVNGQSLLGSGEMVVGGGTAILEMEIDSTDIHQLNIRFTSN